jgi:hypothetical protein
MTYGNDKVVTARNYRPSFGMSCGEDVRILEIPFKIIEEAVKKLANTGENKEKTDFMKKFYWFSNFTQSLKTKFNNCLTKKVFYPGAKLIEEGTNDKLAYIIISGTCSLVSYNSNQKLAVLEYAMDPTKAFRDKEDLEKRASNNNTKQLKITKSLKPLI